MNNTPIKNPTAHREMFHETFLSLLKQDGNGINQRRLQQALDDSSICKCQACFCCYVKSNYKK